MDLILEEIFNEEKIGIDHCTFYEYLLSRNTTNTSNNVLI